MNRRGFLSTLLGAATAAVVVQALERQADALTLTGTPRERFLEHHGYLATLDKAHALFIGYMAEGGLPVDPATVMTRSPGCVLGLLHPRMGASGPVVLAHQLSSTTDDRYIVQLDPAIRQLADGALWHGLDRWGRLQTHLPGVIFADTSGPLRMIVQYDLRTDGELVRFDVLGGSSSGRISRARAKSIKRSLTHTAERRRLNPQRLP